MASVPFWMSRQPRRMWSCGDRVASSWTMANPMPIFLSVFVRVHSYRIYGGAFVSADYEYGARRHSAIYFCDRRSIE